MNSTTVRTLKAIDLTQAAEFGPLWRTLRVAAAGPSETPPGLPRGGLATPTGFWFVEVEPDGPPDPHSLRVEFAPPGAPRRHSAPGTPRLRESDQRSASLRLPGRVARAIAPELSDGLTLDVGPRRALVGVNDPVRPCVIEPILLLISQCWRFLEIERRLDALSALSSAGITKRTSKTLDGLQSIRSLVLDLPNFEGPLVDPRGYFPSRRSALLYRTCSRRLELGPWRERIGERIEILESTLSALVDDRRHTDSLAWMICLEALILLALFVDIGLNLYATFFQD